MCHSGRHPAAGRVVRAQAADDFLARPDLRASDAEREAVVARLRLHGEAGRLDVDELEERVGAAYAARTHRDLAWLLRDLPAVAAPARPARPARAPVCAPSRGLSDDVRTFAGVSLLLVAIWLLAGAGVFWPVWVMAWWGAALAIKASARARGHRVGTPPSP